MKSIYPNKSKNKPSDLNEVLRANDLITCSKNETIGTNVSIRNVKGHVIEGLYQNKHFCTL